MVDLVGRVLWDVFSNNHTVFDTCGDFDLGSFRASADFLAEELNVRYRRFGSRRDYLDLYMGYDVYGPWPRGWPPAKTDE